jgi:hypothetical protein
MPVNNKSLATNGANPAWFGYLPRLFRSSKSSLLELARMPHKDSNADSVTEQK